VKLVSPSFLVFDLFSYCIYIEPYIHLRTHWTQSKKKTNRKIHIVIFILLSETDEIIQMVFICKFDYFITYL
jgi:hypothetical protein